MNVQKLLKAAALIKKQNPVLSDEMIKIAQELAATPGVDSPAPAAPVEQGSLNPNIKSFANPTSDEEKVTHRLTFTIEAPKNLGELEIMNQLLPVLKEFQQTNGSINIKGYQFTQS